MDEIAAEIKDLESTFVVLRKRDGWAAYNSGGDMIMNLSELSDRDVQNLKEALVSLGIKQVHKRFY